MVFFFVFLWGDVSFKKMINSGGVLQENTLPKISYFRRLQSCMSIKPHIKPNTLFVQFVLFGERKLVMRPASR